MKKPVCQFECQNIEVKVASLNKLCRYHFRQGQKYDQNHLSPSGLCPAAYQAVYPFCLALLYNAKVAPKGKPIKIRCPNPNGYILMEITRKNYLPKSVLFLKEKLENFVKIFRPFELPTNQIKIKIIDQKGCPKKYQIGQVFNFNLWSQKEICPAGFAQIYPFLTKAKAKSKILVPCPDDNVAVYQITKKINQ